VLNKVRSELRDRLLRVVEEVSQRQDHVAEQRHREQLGAIRAEADRVVAAVRGAIHEMEVRARRDVFAAGEREAVASSARFALEAMPFAMRFPHPHATLEHALTVAPAHGLALEFGVYSGQTLKTISAARGGEVYGFDSFKGLPEAWRSGFPAGVFDLDQLPDVPGAELVVGWFDDTVPGFLAEHPGPVSFLHLDADLYSSTRTVLDLVGPRLQPGSIVLFDEYFNYLGWEDHEHRAWREYVARTGTRFEYLGYTIDNEQVIVRITG
jgi:hypothetical protein